MFQSCARRAIQLNFGFGINGHRIYQIQLRQRQVALGGQRLVARARSQILLLFSDIECPLG